ncbi:MAG: hypothetical protein KAQ92_01940, partial [Candidatus Aenigmarchaeota archaeon]|nr:hypothetical protein [Candidatus Aenigmarchaeota archaeon]
ITLLNSTGSPIQNNKITVYQTGTSTVGCEADTDANGKIKCNLENTTNYDIDIDNYDGNILNISAPLNITLQPLNITVLNHNSIPKQDVVVDIYSAGNLISTATTHSNGKTNFTLNNSALYNITVFGNTEPSIQEVSVPSSKTINLNLTLTATMADTIIMPGITNTVSGTIILLPDNTATAFNPVNIYLNETLLTVGSFLNKTYSTNDDLSNGTSVNVTNSSDTLTLDPRGEYYFEAENYISSSGITVRNNGYQPWDGDPSGNQYAEGTHPAWANYNITNIPDGNYYIFVKMYAGATDRMVNITWDGNIVDTTAFGSYSGDILWSNALSQTVTKNSTSHTLGF